MAIPESEYLSPVWREGIFRHRVVFVTGGAGTICSIQTRALVRLGANACIVGRNKAKTEAAAQDIATARPGARVIAIGECDVREIQGLEAAAKRCVRELGGIDFVMECGEHSAGAAGNFIMPLAAMSTNAFKSVMDIDAIGTFNTVKATMPHLIRSPTPRLIFISANMHYTGMPLQAHMTAAKAAVDALMASVALEYGPRGVTCNVIAPGGIKGTEGMARLWGPGEQATEDFTAAIPLGRLGTGRDIADATVFLFSEAGSYINGQVIPVDGGSWRRQAAITLGPDPSLKYPKYLLEDAMPRDLKGSRSVKL